MSFKNNLHLHLFFILTTLLFSTVTFDKIYAETEASKWGKEGVKYYTNEQYASAIKQFEKAIKINPDYHAARYLLALSYHYIGNNEKAREHLEYITENADLQDKYRIKAEKRLNEMENDLSLSPSENTSNLRILYGITYHGRTIDFTTGIYSGGDSQIPLGSSDFPSPREIFIGDKGGFKSSPVVLVSRLACPPTNHEFNGNESTGATSISENNATFAGRRYNEMSGWQNCWIQWIAVGMQK